MTPGHHVKSLLRRFARRHPRLNSAIRAFFFFSIAFGAAFGFISGARSGDYNPHTFAVGISFLFAVACTALAVQNMRYRWLRRQVRKIAAKNETLADRNWELKDAEERARHLFEAQGDFVVRRTAEGRITFANDAYCQLAGLPREQRRPARCGRAGVDGDGDGRNAHSRPEDRGQARPALDRLAREHGSSRRQFAGGAAMRRPRRDRPGRDRA
jgi:PAS domain-containing protein